MSETEHAWAAGFLDGEGYFYISPRKRYSPDYGIQAAQVVRDPLDVLQAMYGGSVALRSGRGARRDFYSWRVHSQCAMRYVLPLLIPYLVVKREKAEQMLRELPPVST